MKKLFFTLLSSIVLALGAANAQSCCTIQKQNCKTMVCCPTTSNCCEEGGKAAGNEVPTRRKMEASRTKLSINKVVSKKIEVSKIDPKKIKI